MNDLCFAEGGQSSTGSALTWMKRFFPRGSGMKNTKYLNLAFKELDKECTESPPGARGLLCIETFKAHELR